MRNWKRINRYIRISLILLIFVSVLTSAISLLLSKYFSEYAFSEVNHYTKSNMIQTIKNSEFVLNRLWENSFRIYTDIRVQKYLEQKEITPSDILEVRPVMTNYLINEPFIYSINLVNPSARTIYNSRHGPFTYDNFFDTGILDRISNQDGMDLNYFKHEVNGQPYLALIIHHGDWKGYLIMLLDVWKLETYLLGNNPNTEKGIKVAVLDSRGELMLGEVASPDLYHTMTEHRQNARTGYYEASIQNEPWAINYGAMSTNNWTMYHFTKISSWQEKVNDFYRIIAYYSVGFIAVLFLIILWQSRKNYRPIVNLANQMKSKFMVQMKNEEEEEIKEEYEIIQKGFNFLLHSVDKMSYSLKEHKQVVKNEYLRQWIFQGRYNEPMLKFFKENTSLFDYSKIRIAIVRISFYKAFTEKYHLSSRKTMKFAIGNISEEIIGKQGWAVESIDFGSDHLVLIIGTENLTDNRLFDFIQDIDTQSQNYLKTPLTLAVSDPKNHEEDLRAVYDKLHELSMIRFITGENRVYWEPDIEQYKAYIDPSPDEDLSHVLVQTVRWGTKEKIGPALDQAMKHMQKLSYSECRFQLTWIVYSVVKAFNQTTSLQSFDGIQKQLDSFHSLQEAREWLEYELKEIMNHISQRKSSGRKEELVNEIMEYVQANLHDPILSVDRVADHISLSTNYTRQIFKEAFGQTLTDYILVQRIENTKKLLSVTDWNIWEVAERSGFQTKSHFFTVFKKVTGMTPAQYREDNQTAADENS